MAALWLGIGAVGCEQGDAVHLDPTAGAMTGFECGELSCPAEVRVSLVAGRGLFLGGTYDVQTVIAGELRRCSFVLDDDFSVCGEEGVCVERNDCDASFLLLVFPQSITLHVPTSADSLELTVLHQGEPVGRSSVTPRYSEYRPNGPGCDPVCQLASAQLELR